MTAVLQHNSETYTFASQPRAVPQRKKYREVNIAQQNDKRAAQYGNIMYDRRIIRGSTYASNVIPTTAQPDPIELQRQQAAKRRQMAKKQAKLAMRVRSPDAVEGRKHVEVQSELYLEELSDRVEEADTECQTDAFLDRPPSPLFVPAKSGVDIATQILDGELFDFDVEVKPILEVLVGKTVEQSLLEVMEEEELSNLRQQQRQFEELRNVELAEQQRLEEQDRRLREEKERRMRQEQDRQNKDKETGNKIAAHAFAHGYLSDLLPAVFGSLSDYGYFYDPVERDVEQNFVPWLMDEMEEKLKRNELSRVLLDTLIRQVTQQRQEDYEKLEEILNAPPQEPVPADDSTQKAAADGDASLLVTIEPPAVVIEGSSPVPPTGETGEGVEPQGAEEDGPAADEEDTA